MFAATKFARLGKLLTPFCSYTTRAKTLLNLPSLTRLHFARISSPITNIECARRRRRNSCLGFFFHIHPAQEPRLHLPRACRRQDTNLDRPQLKLFRRKS